MTKKNVCPTNDPDLAKVLGRQRLHADAILRYGKRRRYHEPYTFLRAIGPEPWAAAYVEPSRRPADGRYGENPNRLYQHHQFQVVIKPSPKEVQNYYLNSLRALGIEPLEHDIRFVEDNWENPSMGCAGVGWEVWLDGMEVTQFTYFQVVGGLKSPQSLPKSLTALNA